MKAKLRGHHLICLHFFEGRDSNKEFKEYLAVLRKNSGNLNIEVVEGADDACKKCQYLQGNKCNYSNMAEKEIRKMDNHALSLLNLGKNTASWKEIKDKIPFVFNEWFFYCKDCEWSSDCKQNKDWRIFSKLK